VVGPRAAVGDESSQIHVHLALACAPPLLSCLLHCFHPLFGRHGFQLPSFAI
jgi:hypothetical protein